MARERPHGEDRPEKTTYRPGDSGRMIRPDGTEQWWVRSPQGTWVALRHQRVMPNDDGSITPCYWSGELAYTAKALGGAPAPPSHGGGSVIRKQARSPDTAVPFLGWCRLHGPKSSARRSSGYVSTARTRRCPPGSAHSARPGGPSRPERPYARSAPRRRQNDERPHCHHPIDLRGSKD
jgi:hypothetical protein